jgi:diguanylate cyclase (GGDEF)-like protein/PAS domain S-box-containing protein
MTVSHPAHGAWHDEARLARLVTWIAAAIALTVAAAGPAGYLWLSVRGERNESAIAARLHAAFVTQAINVASGDWRDDVSGLIETELSASALPEQRLIVDAAGDTVAASGDAVPTPRLLQSAPLPGRAGVVGHVMVVRSLRPLLWRALPVALLSGALGVAIYLSLRMLPLRALRRTLQALRAQEAQARERVEAELRMVLDHSIEGVLVFQPSGQLRSCNPAAARMLGLDPVDLARATMTTVLQPPAQHAGCDPFPIGQYETVAHRSGGGDIPVELAVSEFEVGGVVQRLAIVRDITERRQHEARLSHMANYDSLTGLPNRSLFRDRLQRAMARSRRSGRPCALMFLDLDRFKHINDSLGHDVGDRLLVEVAKVLAACLRETDSLARAQAVEQGVYRLGGDEFTVLVEDLSGTEALVEIALRILRAVKRPFTVDEHELFVSASIGITVYVDDGTDLDGLIKQADMAMYRSKELGRDTHFFYNEELNREATERHHIEALLRHALARNEFRLHFQPKADLRSGQVIGVEALLRWQPAGQAVIGPDRFIPLLEETGLIVPVGSWVLREGCAQMMRWQRAGMRPITLAVNLSARQFRQPDLIGDIDRALKETGFDPTLLEIELTESMLIDDSEAVLGILTELGAMGVRIAIDDFGTGQSSLSYLKRFDLDTLKIDRSFVRDTPDDAEDSAIATAVIALAHGLRLNVVAEGVETAAQLEFLRAQGCDQMQGYLLSKPLDADAFARWLRTHEQGQRALAPQPG